MASLPPSYAAGVPSKTVMYFVTQAMAKGGPITITHKDITRYFMMIPEVTMLVITADAVAKGGEIFVYTAWRPGSRAASR